MQKVMVLLGSNRPGRNVTKIADWFKNVTAERTDMEFEFVDIAELNLPMYDEPVPPSMSRAYQHEHTKKWSELVAKFDAYVVITPEYNHGYPAVLKNAFDYLYEEWRHKPIGFVGYGVNQGIRAVEQLRQVVANLQMAPVNTSHVGFNIITEIDQQGQLIVHDGKAAAANSMLDELKWWSEALSVARAKE